MRRASAQRAFSQLAEDLISASSEYLEAAGCPLCLFPSYFEISNAQVHFASCRSSFSTNRLCVSSAAVRHYDCRWGTAEYTSGSQRDLDLPSIGCRQGLTRKPIFHQQQLRVQAGWKGCCHAIDWELAAWLLGRRRSGFAGSTEPPGWLGSRFVGKSFHRRLRQHKNPKDIAGGRYHNDCG